MSVTTPSFMQVEARNLPVCLANGAGAVEVGVMPVIVTVYPSTAAPFRYQGVNGD